MRSASTAAMRMYALGSARYQSRRVATAACSLLADTMLGAYSTSVVSRSEYSGSSAIGLAPCGECVLGLLLHIGQYGAANQGVLSPGPGMSRHQNSGSQSVAGTRRPRRGGRDGAPAWSAAWTAAATSCAVSASMTMFRRSRTRRTTCPACGGASCGPMVAGEGPVASGSVTPGTVEETVLARLPDTPDLQRLLRRSPGGARPVQGSVGDHVADRSFLDRPRAAAPRVARRCNLHR